MLPVHYRHNYKNVQNDLMTTNVTLGKCSPYSITERRVPELIPVLGRQPEGDVSH